MCFKFDILIIV